VITAVVILIIVQTLHKTKEKSVVILLQHWKRKVLDKRQKA